MAEEGEEVPDAEPAGGIQPDIVQEGEPGTRYGFELVRQNHFFRFAVNWTASHDVPRDFRADDKVLAAFKKYLDEQEFDYQTAAEAEIEQLRELGDKEEFDASTVAAIDTLEERVEAEKSHDFERNRDYVEFGIEREVLQSVYGTEAMYEVSLRNDRQFQAAVDLLLDQPAYLAALEGKAPVTAVAERADAGADARMADGESGYHQ
jgi:carboxyl-terminal processing protease